MIYAEIVSNESYYDTFPKLLGLIEQHYSSVESGVQGDAWIWININNERIALDTFTSMQFQIKSNSEAGILVEELLTKLKKGFKLKIYETPEPEAHDD